MAIKVICDKCDSHIEYPKEDRARQISFDVLENDGTIEGSSEQFGILCANCVDELYEYLNTKKGE